MDEKIKLPNEKIIKAVFSNPISKNTSAGKISFRLISGSNKEYYLKEESISNKMFSESLDEKAFMAYISEKIENKEYKNINLFTDEKEYIFLTSKKGKTTLITHIAKQKPKAMPHNIKKNYLIDENSDAPFLKDLGIVSKDGKIINSMYDKYRQINRFAEILDHSFKNIDKKEISILDFGCGKSYLTFIIYYYFSRIKNIKVKITGYDLKSDVVENCNALAKKYGYNGLKFVVSNVETDKLSDEKIDMIISLHACDTATDAALNFAIKRKVDHIFSVPCCQHQINKSIKCGGDYDILLKHGLIKERFSALLTDAIRLEILEAAGYETDAIEFVDFEHSPKNLMIRAKRKKDANSDLLEKLNDLSKKYGFEQALLDAIAEK